MSPNFPASTLYRIPLVALAVALVLGMQTAERKMVAETPQPQRLQTQFVLIGDHDSRNLSEFHLNGTTGDLTPVSGSPFALEVSPKFLAVTPDGTYVFVAGEDAAAIWAYRIDPGGALHPVEGSPFQIAGKLRGLAMDHSGKHLYAIDEAEDAVSIYTVDKASGRLSALQGSPFAVQGTPSGIALDPSDKWAFISEADGNHLSLFPLNPSSGALSSQPRSVVETEVSPDAIALSTTGSELYAAGAKSGQVAVFQVDAVKGSLTPAPGSPFRAGNAPGDLLPIADGATLFVGSSGAGGLSSLAMNLLDTQAITAAPADPAFLSWSEVRSTGTYALASDASERFLFAVEANSGMVTRYQIDPQTHQISPGSGLSYATGDFPTVVAVANAIAPQVTEAITVSLTNGSLLTFASTTGDVHISAPAVTGSDSTCAGQVIQLAFSVPSIAVISTATANPATSVCILTGKQDASFTVTTNANSGSSTLTGFATGFTDGTTTLSVSLRGITLSLPYTNIGVGHSLAGTVSLANPAPTGGAVISLASSATQTATISPSTVTIPVGSVSAPFTVSGVQANNATLTGSVASGGYTSASLAITVLPAGLTINLPLNAVVAPGQSLPYPISIGAAAASAVSVAFSESGGPGTATISPNPVVIPKGATSPTTAPTITGGYIGPLTVTGSASGYASDTESATVQITLTFNPNTLSVETGATGNLTLSASAVAPTGGFSITLASSDTTKATVTSPILIPAGQSSVTVPIQGIAAGNATVKATAPGAIAGSASITVYAPPGITLYGPNGSSNFTAGNNSVVAMGGTLAVAPQGHTLNVTLTTPMASSLLLSATSTAAGSHSIMVTVPANSTTVPTFYAQAIAATGTAAVTGTATGYSNGTATATFTLSGFVIQGGTSTTTFSGTSPVTVYFAQLDPTSKAFTAYSTLRPGLTTINVALKETDTPTGVGSLGSTTLAFNSGDSQHQTTFQPVGAGTAVIGFSATPAGYTAPSNDATTTFTVTAPNSYITFCNGAYIQGTGAVTLGYNGTCTATAGLATAAPTGGRTVTLTSSDPSKMLLSTSATAVGVASISLTIPAGSTTAPSFYVESEVSTGSATITETVSGYNSTTATVNFAPSGFIVQGGTGTTTFSGTSPVTVYFVQLDPTSKAFTAYSTLRPGLTTINVGLKETDTPAGIVGSLGSTTLAFNSGDSQHQTTFQPANPGTAVIGISATPAGYATPASNTTTTFTVTAPNSYITFCNGAYIQGTGAVTLGYNGTCTATAGLATAAPTGGRTVTLTSNSSSLLLSASSTTVGTTSVTVNIPAGSTSAPEIYIQALASSGKATITETVSGYNSTAATVNFAPSGFIVQGGTSTTTFSGTSPVTVYFAQLDPTSKAFTAYSTLRPGLTTINVALKETDTPTGVGSLGSTTLAFNSGDSQHQTTFQPVGAGTAVIGFSATPAGYTAPSNDATTTFTVTAPNSYITFCNSAYIQGTGAVTLGYNGTCTATAGLATAAPTGGRTVTLTSSDPSKMLLSTSATAVGVASISLTIPAGSTTAPSFYVESEVSTGSATITETVSGYNSTTATVNFAPSGFIVQGGTGTTTFSGTSPVTVYFVQLDPTSKAFTAYSTLRPGLTTINVGLKETDTPAGIVGSLGSTTLAFNSGDSQHQTTFQPANPGTAVIGISATPAGYATPASNTTTTFTVTAPNSYITFCNGAYIQGTGAVTLGYNGTCTATAGLATAAPTGGRTVTLTSSDPSKLLLSKTASAVGVASISLSIPAGSTSAPSFYIQSEVSTGSAIITETVPGYNSTQATINFAPSSFIIQGGTGTTTFSGTSPVTVYFVQLDPITLNLTGYLTLRPGLAAIDVDLKETDTPTGVGSLGSTTLIFNSGDTQHQTTFQPKGTPGMAVIGLSATPAGFCDRASPRGGHTYQPCLEYATPSSDATTTFTVTAPAITVQPVTVGNYLETYTYGYLEVAAPTGGRTVTISAPSGSSMLLSTSATAKGTTSLSFSVAAGSASIPTFYVQSQGGGAGTVKLTVSAPGYTTGTTAITVYPSGFALQGSNFTTHLSDNPTTLTIVPAALDPTYLNIYAVQQLIPNLPIAATGTLNLTVQSGTPPVGKFSLNSVTFKGADNPNYLTSSFEPESAGTALITINSSSGFTNASTQITATVVSP